MKNVGKDKWVMLNADGIDVKNTVKGIMTQQHYKWSQIHLIEITDRSVLLGKFTKIKFSQLRIVFDVEKYTELCEQYIRNVLEQHHSDKLASCCFDMEYTQAVMEEIKRYCDPKIVYRKKA
jgi:hypothetical protein